MKSHFKIALCLIFSFLFIFSSINMPYVKAQTDEEKINKMREEQKKLDAKIAEANEKINKIKKDIGEHEEYAKELHSQISDLQLKIDKLNDEISIYRGQIDALNAQIAEKERQISRLNLQIEKLQDEIKECEDDIEDTKELLKERLIALYMQGESSRLELFLSSNSIANFLMRIELVENVTEHDTNLINEIREITEKLEKDKKAVQDKREEVEVANQLINDEKADIVSKENQVKQSRNEVKGVQDEVTVKWQKVRGIIGDMESLSSQNKSLISKYQKDKDAFERQIDQLIRERASTGSGSTAAGFITPMAYTSSYYVSSHYGQRSGGFHGGVDITLAGAYGTPIRAVKSGKVIIATYHYSYGNYVVLDHGEGVTTYYAHCSSLAVSLGQNVSQGTVVGYVGNTGYSTGPHLHFEVRINGTRQNPANYIALP